MIFGSPHRSTTGLGGVDRRLRQGCALLGQDIRRGSAEMGPGAAERVYCRPAESSAR